MGNTAPDNNNEKTKNSVGPFLFITALIVVVVVAIGYNFHTSTQRSKQYVEESMEITTTLEGNGFQFGNLTYAGPRGGNETWRVWDVILKDCIMMTAIPVREVEDRWILVVGVYPDVMNLAAARYFDNPDDLNDYWCLNGSG